MNCCFILFALLPFIAAEDDDYRTVKHICMPGGKMVFQVSLMSNDTIHDIFSTDLENNCSLSNNDFVGNGTEEFPYRIVVDVSNHLNLSKKPCGAKIFNGSFEVQFAIKSHEYFFLEHDRVYTIQCELNNPLHSVFTMTSVHKEIVDAKTVAVEMKLVLSENSQSISDGKLQLGENVKLKIEILKDNFAKRAHVTLCYVHADKLNKTKLLFYNRCPVSSFPVLINFTTNEKNPHVIESTDFEAFKFDKKTNVQFSCLVELCSDEKDLYCMSTDCTQKGTFMRYYTEVKTALFEVYSGASKQGFFMPMSVAVIIISLPKIVCF